MARKKKEVKKEEVSRKEINGLVFVTYDDGSVEITMAPITLTKEQVEDIFGETEEAEEDEEEEELTGEALAEMDFEELEDVCDDKDLETDPDDFEEDDIEKLRKAIAKELGLKLPAKKEAKGKGKKGKK